MELQWWELELEWGLSRQNCQQALPPQRPDSGGDLPVLTGWERKSRASLALLQKRHEGDPAPGALWAMQGRGRCAQ